MFPVIDTASSQRYLNFAAPIAEGYDRVYVKMGGDNVDTYVAPYYTDQIDKARSHGYKRIGHYWVANADPSDADDVDTPVQQADYMVERLHNWNPRTDFIVLDNESLDGAIRFNDAQTAEFIERVKESLGIPGRQVLTYSGLADARGTEWPLTLATGTNFIIAAYSYEPFAWDDFASIPRERIVGHQHGGRPFAAIPGSPVQQVVTDVNQFTDDAFDFIGGLDMSYLDVRPAKGNMNQGFGPRPKPTPTSPAIHYGQDYGWGGGDAIYAARGGRVASYASSGAYGNRLVIDHGDGRQTWYCHLASAVVGVGAQVSAGQQVAWMGATGNVTAKHLHFELRINGVASDPEPYFPTGSTAGGGYTPIEEDDMFTEEDRSKLNSVWSGLYIGGPAVPGGGSIVSLIDGLANRVWWDSTVDRNGDHIPALQELADAKTLALRLEAQVAALTAAVGALAAGSGADPQAIEDAARAGAEEALKGHADGVAAAVREKFRTDPLT